MFCLACEDKRNSQDAAGLTAQCQDASALGKSNGQPCSCDAECGSGFCAEGVCCNGDCSAGCRSCAMPGNEGTCLPLPVGIAPREAGTCTRDSANPCGQDGMCDGNGMCRMSPAGTVCRQGACSGDAVTGISVCDGKGTCRAGADVICVPYACDATTSSCVSSCSSNLQCANGRECTGGSCGPKANGVACAQAAECASGFCADGVCCASACKGECVSCNQVGRAVGRCLPVPDDAADPHGVCQKGTALCGETGLCRAGLCSKAAAGSACAPSYCTGDVLVQASACDGAGVCRTGLVHPCAPYRCVSAAGAAACLEACTDDKDCVAPAACVAGSCGKKQNGGTCSADEQCLSGICADGACCNDRCAGACRSCRITGSVGVCTMVGSNNPDPRGVCTDQKVSSCGTSGRCDGSGGCQRYPAGAVCAEETCTGASATPASTCDGAGHCLKPRTLSCFPFQCNGKRCYESCSSDAQCVSPNLCNLGSCGLKNNGAGCSSGAECNSGICAQGVCCGQWCSGACRSCALPAWLGSCHAVLDGAPDPAGVCADQGAPSCGTDGLCVGGSCARYPAGAQCAPPVCTGFTATSARVCDGAGHCGASTQSSCFPFTCGTSECRATCSSNADCTAPAVCIGNSCGLKRNGTSCSTAAECQSARCVDGVCCDVACTGACRACNLSGHAGVCTLVSVSQPDPRGLCSAVPMSTCGVDGTCDGQGGCHLYGAGTPCAGPRCNGSSLTNGSTCDGQGQCLPGANQSCAPYVCESAVLCGVSCTSNANCVAGQVCVGGSCGNALAAGQSCSRSDQCVSGHCTDGVCCASTSCGTCQSCNAATPGTCSNMSPGALDSRCVAAPPCGNTGACDGAGACASAPATVACGSPSCTAAVLTTYHCSGAGACVSTTASCGAFQCASQAAACLIQCTDSSGCVAPRTCSNGNCIMLPNGDPCTYGAQCISGFCVDSVCCGSSSCAPYRCGSGGVCRSSCIGDTDCVGGTRCSAGVCDASTPDAAV